MPIHETATFALLPTSLIHSLSAEIRISLETIIHISILIIVAYYLKKFVAIFPFLLKWMDKKYIPSYHQESAIGIAIGVGYIFNKTQDKLDIKLDYLTKYLNL